VHQAIDVPQVMRHVSAIFQPVARRRDEMHEHMAAAVLTEETDKARRRFPIARTEDKQRDVTFAEPSFGVSRHTGRPGADEPNGFERAEDCAYVV
jgi:hypothetical protein